MCTVLDTQTIIIIIIAVFVIFFIDIPSIFGKKKNKNQLDEISQQLKNIDDRLKSLEEKTRQDEE